VNQIFYKYQGTGNDFILIDDRAREFPTNDQKLIAHLCHRRYGIGADGLILLQPDEQSEFYMQYFNSDGSESTMCGNGGRCIAQFAYDLKIVSEKLQFRAIDGMHESHINGNNLVALQMKNVSSVTEEPNGVFILNTGSPHYVQFIDQNIAQIDIVQMARAIRYSDRFATDGINVNFVQVMPDNSLAVRTYERGVEDETYSCGTGVTASAIAYAFVQNRILPSFTVRLGTPGGALRVTFNKTEESYFTDVWLEGPAKFVYQGVYTF
jgi:diaminopimelate epimerase